MFYIELDKCNSECRSYRIVYEALFSVDCFGFVGLDFYSQFPKECVLSKLPLKVSCQQFK